MSASAWKTLQRETVNGHVCELRFGEWGKGPTFARKWRMFIDGEQVSYAANEQDAEANWRHTLARAAETPKE